MFRSILVAAGIIALAGPMAAPVAAQGMGQNQPPDQWVMNCNTERGLDHEFEYRAIRADGATIWVQDIVTLERDADGRVTCLRGLMLVLAVLGIGAPWRAAAAQARMAPARSQAPAGAWALPDAESLVSKAIVRIITQDRPAGIPIAEYRAKRFGRAATSEAVRQYNGQTLPTSAFAPVADWPETRALDVDPCPAVGGAGCATPNGVWVAITRIERGELPHEINLSYTTQFTAAPRCSTASAAASATTSPLRLANIEPSRVRGSRGRVWCDLAGNSGGGFYVGSVGGSIAREGAGLYFVPG